MIKMFDTFRRWCDQNNIAADQYEITIAPRSIDAAMRLEYAWHRETQNLTLRPSPFQLPTSGHIYGIPFRYRRPAKQDRPFGEMRGE